MADLTGGSEPLARCEAGTGRSGERQRSGRGVGPPAVIPRPIAAWRPMRYSLAGLVMLTMPRRPLGGIGAQSSETGGMSMASTAGARAFYPDRLSWREGRSL